jgi:hypothetical protein
LQASFPRPDVSLTYHPTHVGGISVIYNRGLPAGTFFMQDYQFFLMLGLVLVAFILFKLVQAYYYYQAFKVNYDWPETLGTVVEAKIDQKYPRIRGQIPFWVEIKYFYTIVGSKYYGTLIIKPYLPSTDILVRDFKAHPVGSTFLIRYNPEKPAVHITEYDKFIFDWGRIIIAFVWAAIIFYAAYRLSQLPR